MGRAGRTPCCATRGSQVPSTRPRQPRTDQSSPDRARSPIQRRWWVPHRQIEDRGSAERSDHGGDDANRWPARENLARATDVWHHRKFSHACSKCVKIPESNECGIRTEPIYSNRLISLKLKRRDRLEKCWRGRFSNLVRPKRCVSWFVSDQAHQLAPTGINNFRAANSPIADDNRTSSSCLRGPSTIIRCEAMEPA